jgi:glycosyltransferase involved in cell wall biosynthesis
LEAGLAGANVVSTDRGYARDYLVDFAWYCDPSNKYSIKQAILSAYNTRKTTKLQRHIYYRFTWEKNIDKIISIYQFVLNKRQ